MAKRGDSMTMSVLKTAGNLAQQIAPHLILTYLCQHIDHLTRMTNSTKGNYIHFSLLSKKK